jgi:hypothetical protein
MKPEQFQDQLTCQVPAPEPRQFTARIHQTPEREPKETDAFEAILEAYAQDPERWDGLE